MYTLPICLSIFVGIVYFVYKQGSKTKAWEPNKFDKRYTDLTKEELESP